MAERTELDPVKFPLVFDIAGRPPDSAQLAAHRKALAAQRARCKLGWRLGAMVTAAVVAGVLWLAATPTGAPPNASVAMAELVVGLGAQLAGMVSLLGALLFRRRWKRAERGLGALAELEYSVTPRECLGFVRLCGKDTALRAYQHRVAALGRKPVMGEYLAAQAWVKAAARKREKAVAADAARQACVRLGSAL